MIDNLDLNLGSAVEQLEWAYNSDLLAVVQLDSASNSDPDFRAWFPLVP